MQRLSVFIDMSNILSAAKLKNFKIDFSKLKDYILRGRPAVRMIAYLVQLDKKANLDPFVYALRNLDYEVRIKFAQKMHDGRIKADWDIAIVVDIMAATQKLDTICLVTGDGDFISLVNYLKGQGIKVEGYAVKGPGVSRGLRLSCDEFFDITQAQSSL